MQSLHVVKFERIQNHMSYLAIFNHSGDDTGSWSIEVNSLDKKTVCDALFAMVSGGMTLDYATILVIQNGESFTRMVDGEQITDNMPPKVVRHWSALNGDFEGM